MPGVGVVLSTPGGDDEMTGAPNHAAGNVSPDMGEMLLHVAGIGNMVVDVLLPVVFGALLYRPVSSSILTARTSHYHHLPPPVSLSALPYSSRPL